MHFIDWTSIDWNAVSAIATALAAGTAWIIWVADGASKRRSRKATTRLLSQIMITPVSEAQVYIAKIRTSVASSNDESWHGFELLEFSSARVELYELVSGIVFQLPDQFLDKADLFSEKLSNRLALAYSMVSRLKNLSLMFSELPDSVSDDVVEQYFLAFLKLIQETEKAIEEAHSALLIEGRSSVMLRLFGSKT